MKHDGKEITHKSKIGLEILVPITLILGAATVILTINLAWVGLLVCGLIILLMVNIYTGTYYKITPDHRLFIKCGVLESLVIDVNEIEWIKKSNELASFPALSIDRLEIGYKGGRVLVSPVDKEKFIADLRNLNPKIWWTN